MRVRYFLVVFSKTESLMTYHSFLFSELRNTLLSVKIQLTNSLKRLRDNRLKLELAMNGKCNILIDHQKLLYLHKVL